MILTPEIEQKIIDAITANPDAPTILPDHAYGAHGRVVVLVDGLPIDLHRHLHNVLIRPLGFHEQMLRLPGISPRNVNPHLFHVTSTGAYRSTRTHCVNNHAYEGNEAPPNSYRFRCATCLRAFLDRKRDPNAGQANGEKTHCPYNHPYDEENTIHTRDGRRKCRTCKRAATRRYMAARRKEQKTS